MRCSVPFFSFTIMPTLFGSFGSKQFTDAMSTGYVSELGS